MYKVLLWLCMICFQTPVSQDEAYSAFDNIGLSQSTKSLDKESLKPLVIPTDRGTVHCSSRITSYAIFVTVESACNKSLCYNCTLTFLFTVFHELYRNCSRFTLFFISHFRCWWAFKSGLADWKLWSCSRNLYVWKQNGRGHYFGNSGRTRSPQSNSEEVLPEKQMQHRKGKSFL